MVKKVTIKIIDTPVEAVIIAHEIRCYLLHNTAAFVWDDCGVGSTEQPRCLEAAFPGEWRVMGENSVQNEVQDATATIFV